MAYHFGCSRSFNVSVTLLLARHDFRLRGSIIADDA